MQQQKQLDYKTKVCVMSMNPVKKPVAHTTTKVKEMNNDDIQLSPHFKLSEFAYTSHKKYQEKNLEYAKTMINRLEGLADFLEKVREVCGTKLLITSGVRCPELNTAVGGVKTSQHLSGHAVDFIPRGNGTIQDHFCKIYDSHLIYDQLVLEESGGKIWIHISYAGMNGRREALYYNGKKYVNYVKDK